MDTSNLTIERVHHVGGETNNKERVTVVQFSFYKDKINIPRNCKKLKRTKISIFDNFSKEVMQTRVK